MGGSVAVCAAAICGRIAAAADSAQVARQKRGIEITPMTGLMDAAKGPRAIRPSAEVRVWSPERNACGIGATFRRRREQDSRDAAGRRQDQHRLGQNRRGRRRPVRTGHNEICRMRAAEQPGSPLSDAAELALPKQIADQAAKSSALGIGRQRRKRREQGLQRNGIGRDQTDRRPKRARLTQTRHSNHPAAPISAINLQVKPPKAPIYPS